MSKKEIINRIKAALYKYPISKLILYGSRAREDNSAISDWDILIILDSLNNKNEKEKILDIFFELELETNQIFCPVIHTKDEWEKLKITPFYQNVSQDGIIL